MTKAQEVMFEKSDKEIESKAEEIFDWILNVLDNRTKKENYLPLILFLWSDECVIRTAPKMEKNEMYDNDLNTLFQKYDRDKLFVVLKKVIEQEDGFIADLNLDDKVWDAKSISLRITKK